MAEFGENLKRIREGKGMTQQTLADYLYVTRQAVSRWEGGSRYPDLMTAKKMAEFLETSVDELLADDDMKLSVQKQGIVENPVTKQLQMVLLSLAFMSAFIMSIFYMNNFFMAENVNIQINGGTEPWKNAILTCILGYATYMAIFDKLNQKVAVVISVLYFGTAIITGVLCLVDGSGSFHIASILGAMMLIVVLLVLCIRFFGSTAITSPVPLYIAIGGYAVSGLISSIISMVNGTTIEWFKYTVMSNTFMLLQKMLLLALLFVWARVLDRKRRLVNR